MRKHQQLATRIGVVVAAATLVASSAFADSRHRNETRHGGEGRHSSRQERSAAPRESQRGYRSPRNYDRSNSRNDNRSWNRGNDSRSWNRGHNGNGNNWRRNDSHWGGGSRSPYYHSGRISRILPWNGGFRIFIGGAPYPFFVPRAYWDPFRFRLGLSINLGGYYNPLGYYDYYNGPYYSNGPYTSGPEYSDGIIRGTVESVDYRGRTFVMRNDATGSFVTIDNAGRGGRDVRPGDYVEVQGDWRGGLFSAYSVALLDNGRDDYQR